MKPLWRRIWEALQNGTPLPEDANDNVALPGRVERGMGYGIDDGGGYPFEDPRPDFVKKDEEGWRKIR